MELAPLDVTAPDTSTGLVFDAPVHAPSAAAHCAVPPLRKEPVTIFPASEAAATMRNRAVFRVLPENVTVWVVPTIDGAVPVDDACTVSLAAANPANMTKRTSLASTPAGMVIATDATRGAPVEVVVPVLNEMATPGHQPGSKISYAMVLVSVDCDGVTVNDTPTERADTHNADGVVTVPSVCAVR